MKGNIASEAMADSLRRSSRAPKRSNSTYNVGDIVEITRNNVVAEGRLAYNLTEGPSPNPRWLVKFDGESWKDEELYERVFGKLIRRSQDNPDGPKVSPPTTKRPRGRPKGSSKPTLKSSSSSEADDPAKSKKKNVTFSESSLMNSDADSLSVTGEDDAKKRARASAREQRSLRRQAKIVEETKPAVGGKKRGRPPKTNGGFPNADKRARTEPNEEVIKVPMLTGTLYLYRGLNRRAEFIRRY